MTTPRASSPGRFEANFKEFEPFVGDEVKEVAVRGVV